MSRKELVAGRRGITGQMVQAGGEVELLVEGQEEWEECMGQPVEDTD